MQINKNIDFSKLDLAIEKIDLILIGDKNETILKIPLNQ